LFFALDGVNFKGSDFADEIVTKSDSNWVVRKSEQGFKTSKNTIFVKDPLYVYGQLAKKYLKLFGAVNITLTGSTGKTTTKEILYNILSSGYKTFKTRENENNKIGVPKNIFKMQPYYEYAVFEIGTNQLGEIDYLSEILKPDFGLVISVNASHLDGLRSVDDIFIEKLSLLNHVKKVGIIPSEDKKFFEYKENDKTGKKVFTFGFAKGSDIRILDTEYSNLENGICFKIVQDEIETSYHTTIKIPFLITNISLAIAVASLLSIPKDIIDAGLRKEIDTKNRMEIVSSGNRTIIYDCYNANPSSMSAAVKFWLETGEGIPHYAILGDMLELGDESERYHREIGDLIKDSNNEFIKRVIGVGTLSKYYQPDKCYDNVEELKKSKELIDILDNAVILVKGSNSIKLEKLKGLL